ncbi:MAG: MOSC domain-containing protein [Myxococcales bacterium]|nr:MOSC domain-containing protein [Myxococcales bacterium]
MTATIVQLSISRGGVPKHAVLETQVTRLGLAGDVQKHTKIHGGPDRALCLFSLEVIERLRGEGHPIAPGTTGENVTIRGLDWASLGPGSRLAFGDTVIVEVTELTDPCKQIAGSFLEGQFRRILLRGDSRLYARVIVEGTARRGDAVVIVA